MHHYFEPQVITENKITKFKFPLSDVEFRKP